MVSIKSPAFTLHLSLVWLYLVGLHPKGNLFQKTLCVANIIGLTVIIYMVLIQFYYVEVDAVLFFAMLETLFLIEQV